MWEELAEYLRGRRMVVRRLPKTTLDQFALIDDMVYYVRHKADGSLQYSIVIPKSLIPKATQHSHELSGYLGKKKTILKAEEIFYWHNLKADVCDYVKKCITCQRFKGDKGLQQSWKELPAVGNPPPLFFSIAF